MSVMVKNSLGKKKCEAVRCRDAITNFLSSKLALTSPTSGGLSVVIVRSRTQATEFVQFGAKYSHIFTQSP
jgi:hypothetical protein